VTTPRLLLVDTASLYFRAFYGVPDSVRAPDGTPVNAVRGLLDFLSRLVDQYSPTHLVCCWDDDWRPEWRVALLPSYKAQRVASESETGSIEEVPDELTPQVGIIADALAALGIARVGAAGCEADDVIGSYAAQAEMPVEVVTGDRDLFQVVDDVRRVRVLYVARGVARHEVVTADVVRSKYGIGPEQYADFATLRGDPSDGLPGVSGVGEKTAASLLSEFGDLPGILSAARDAASAMSTGPRTKILAAEAYLAVAPEVVQVRRDLELPGLAGAQLPSGPADASALAGLVDRWGIGSPVRRLSAALGW
jgi:5'-3' exonuclease